ncbi:MAG: DNA polymerase III subunit gamma/tau [Candidatus Saccharimonadales bacterium]
MGKALYRTYRSKSLDDVVGQEHVITTLKRALETGAISHAYLLTGPRGVGKTSIARILAHEINGLPYDDDSTHLDIIEIDAASNRRIDDIRDLRDKVHTAPTSAKYKVYIIDEVHMLTGESFNALLKTLEEPPAHVVFILATTEAHKLPETIISRTQRFTFRPISQEKVVEHLRSIATQENITIDDEALALIAEHGDGSFRDSINLLDQARGQADHIAIEHIQSLLGMPAEASLESIIAAVAAHDSQTVIAQLSYLQLHGHDAARISKYLGRKLRGQLASGTTVFSPQVTMQLLTKLLDIPASSSPFRLLELALLDACFAGVDTAPVTVVAVAPTVTPPAAPAAPAPAKKESFAPSQPEKVAEPVVAETSAVVDFEPVKEVEEKKPLKTIAVGSVDPGLWPEVLNEIKKKYNTLYGIARMANVTSTEDGLKLSFKFAFHQKRVNEAKNKTIIIGIIEQLTGLTTTIECVVDELAQPSPIVSSTTFASNEPVPVPPPEEDNTDNQIKSMPQKNVLQDISNIFGGAEVLNS